MESISQLQSIIPSIVNLSLSLPFIIFGVFSALGLVYLVSVQ